MADLSSTERLQPCLLDRLTDLAPGKQESRSERVVSMSKYRESVLRDLLWLINAGSHLPDEGLDAFPEVEKSVLNFGTRNMCGMSSESLEIRGYEAELERALERFEPRINSGSLKVRRLEEGTSFEKHVLEFEIRGELWAYPMPEQLWIHTKVDLETGDLTISKK
jgi:type VI secretion system protein ImpF